MSSFKCHQSHLLTLYGSGDMIFLSCEKLFSWTAPPKKSLDWKISKWNISRTMQNWVKVARATFVGHVPPNISPSYHVVDWSWSWSWNLKLKFLDTRWNAAAVLFSKNRISRTMTSYDRIDIPACRTPRGLPKRSIEQSHTTPLSGPRCVFRGPKPSRGPSRIQRVSNAVPCIKVS